MRVPKMLEEELSDARLLPFAVAICRYATAKTPQVYLLACSENWEVIGDTDHDALTEALQSAEQSIIGLERTDWQWSIIPPPNAEALLSEKALATDWNRPEEDAAWSHLQEDKTS